jgi:hypothetical protein
MAWVARIRQKKPNLVPIPPLVAKVRIANGASGQIGAAAHVTVEAGKDTATET